MHDTDPNIQPDGGAGDATQRPLLRRRENRAVEVDRRRPSPGFDIAGLLEMHLDQCKTRRAMIGLLDQWLSEARDRGEDSQDPDYISAVERAIEVMKKAPDVETAIVWLQRR